MNESGRGNTSLRTDFKWLESLLEKRLSTPEPEYVSLDVAAIKIPVLVDDNGYSALVMRHDLSIEERILFLLALAPHVQPEVLDALVLDETVQFPTYSIIGGRKGVLHNGFLPTVQTALFLIAGSDPIYRGRIWRLLSKGSRLIKSGIVSLENVSGNEPYLNSTFSVPFEIVDYLFTGSYPLPAYSSEFPVRISQTTLSWEQLVISKMTEKSLEGVMYAAMKSELSSHVIFSGESGTGKSLAANLVGKRSGRPVFTIDCALLLSVHISETERKLEKILSIARMHGAILFLKKCDLFFRRESGLQDRLLLRESSFVQERLIEYNGLVIFSATDYRLLSSDFLRHQNSIVHFYIPEVQHRLKLWTDAIPGDIDLQADIDLKTFAECFVVSGATIYGAVRSAVAFMRARNSNMLQLDDFHWGIQSEYQKLNRKLETRDIFKKSLTHNSI